MGKIVGRSKLKALEQFVTSFQADFRFSPLNILVPSTAVETMGLGAMGGMTAFDRIMGPQKGPADADAPAAQQTGIMPTEISESGLHPCHKVGKGA